MATRRSQAAIGVKGVKVTASRFRKLSKDAQKSLLSRISKVGTKIRRTARQLAPVRTGELRKNIRKRTHRRKAQVTIIGQARYSSFVEYGSVNRNMGAQPYMRPAVERHRAEVLATVKGGVEVAIAKNRAGLTVGAS